MKGAAKIVIHVCYGARCGIYGTRRVLGNPLPFKGRAGVGMGVFRDSETPSPTRPPP